MGLLLSAPIESRRRRSTVNAGSPVGCQTDTAEHRLLGRLWFLLRGRCNFPGRFVLRPSRQGVVLAGNHCVGVGRLQ